MKINNILIITVLYMSITIIVCGIYFYPLYEPIIYLYALLSVITSLLNHMTPNSFRIKNWFQHIDRIVIRISSFCYILLAKKLDKNHVHTIEKYGKQFTSDILIYCCIFIGALLYIVSRIIKTKTKNTNVPTNFVKLPHACSHVLASCATILLFYEYSL